ncbi:MAG TPA: sigma-54 dependent transcriptional regulator, partial [Ignavibacteriaceae bacterium]|nr:sigma-54 dependent transcriptional regulator [Ignavibacteriaceae bacterium]
KISDLASIHMINLNISGWVLKNRKSFLTNNLPEDKRFSGGSLNNCVINSAVGSLLLANSKPIGLLLLLSNGSGRKFSELDVEYANKLSAVISPFINRTDKIHQYFTCVLPENELLVKYSKLGLVGKSKRFIDLLKSIESASRCDVRVLLEGDTGTGKEIVAKAIHKLSSRSDKNFMVLDCASIQDNLIESELFGHTKGSFTGAVKDRPGIIEEANGGTLFIDEINHLPQDMQVKFLRFLQEKEFRPVGSNQIKKSDVRIITASSIPLNELVKEKKMREELLYRLNVYPIRIPSLNDRSEDIMLLTHHFIKIFASQQNKPLESLDTEIMKFMIHKNWAGNIRELENFIERIVTLAPLDEKIIFKNSLPAEHLEEFLNAKSNTLYSGSKKSLAETLEEIEVQILREALINNNWNQSKAAASLSIPEQTLRYKMHKHSIAKP